MQKYIQFNKKIKTLSDSHEIKHTNARFVQIFQLEKYDNMQIVLVSQKDSINLPAINCWCKQNMWILQMDKQGFRLSEEISIVNAASTLLERCVRKVPPERKEKSSVIKYLLTLAKELEDSYLLEKNKIK